MGHFIAYGMFPMFVSALLSALPLLLTLAAVCPATGNLVLVLSIEDSRLLSKAETLFRDQSLGSWNL